MAKNKKLIIKKGLYLVAIAFFVIGIIYNVPVVKEKINTYFVYEYLTKKYNEPKESFDIVKYKPGHISHDSKNSGVPFDFNRWAPLWEVEYNGRLFNVQKVKNRFIYFDDYQLEDFSIWATEYLKDNLDANIINVQVKTSDLYYLQKENKYYRQNPLTKDLIGDYLVSLGSCSFSYKTNKEADMNDKTDIENDLKIKNNHSFRIRVLNLKEKEEILKRSHHTQSWGNKGYVFIGDACYKL